MLNRTELGRELREEGEGVNDRDEMLAVFRADKYGSRQG